MEPWAYEDVLAFVQSWGAVYFMTMFVVAFAYAFWPKNQPKFQKAARMPLDEREDA